MTTINNDQSLIEKVGGIEKARRIVEGTPEYLDTSVYCMQEDQYWDGNGIHCNSCIEVKNISTAIADHDRTDFCTNFENGVSPSTTVINLEVEHHG